MRPIVVMLLVSACAKQAPPSTAEAPPPAEEAREPDAAEQVTFSFGWEPGWRGEVTVVQTEQRVVGADTAETRLPSLGTTSVSEGPDGTLHWRSESDTMEMTSTLNGEPQTASARDTAIAEILTRLPVVARIGRDGSWQGLAEEGSVLTEMQGALTAVADAVRDSMETDADREGFDAMVAQLGLGTIQQQMALQRAAEWSQRTAQWIGASFDAGDEYVADFVQPHPQTGADVPWQTAFLITTGVPCHDASDAPTCVVIDSVTRPDPEAWRLQTLEVTRQAMAAAGQTGEVALSEATTRTALHLVVEPDTMRPWATTRTQVNRVVGAGEDPEVRETTRQTETTYRWE